MMRFSDAEFRRLNAYIAGKYGINLTKKQTLCECRLGLEMGRWGATSLDAFLDAVQADRTGRMEAAMINRLTTNYTYFLRESDHFDFLTRQILPALPAGTERYRAWCAGCATGEECYSLAMTLADYACRAPLPPPDILGTDVSEAALEKARLARYPLRELDQLPPRWQSAYCRRAGDGFEIREEIRKSVTFQKMNLMRPYAGQARYDLILCRNVMIYFGEEARRMLADRLYAALAHGGYLFIGHTELLARDQTRFEYVCPAVYRKV